MTGAVLFDFGGTLDADGIPWSARFHEGYQQLGGGLPAEAFSESFRWSDERLERVEDVARFSLTRMVEEQVRLLREHLPDGATIDPVRWAHGFLGRTQAAGSRNRPLLEALRSRFTLGIVSNFTGNLRPCLAELGLDDLFTVVLDSGEVGIRKPDPKIFAVAFAALGREASECWMVGDNPGADIAPAAALGCRTCWIAPSERPLPAGLRPDRRIASLTELPDALA